MDRPLDRAAGHSARAGAGRRFAILAVAEHGSRASSRRIPPPRPEAIAEMVQAVQDRAERLIRHAAVEQGLDLPLAPDRTQAEPAPAAAPADEQPAPPAPEAPQHDQSAAAAPYRSPIFPERAGDASKPGGADLVHEDRCTSTRDPPRKTQGTLTGEPLHGGGGPHTLAQEWWPDRQGGQGKARTAIVTLTPEQKELPSANEVDPDHSPLVVLRHRGDPLTGVRP